MLDKDRRSVVPSYCMNEISVTLRGRVVSGLGQSKSFTCIPWVKEMFLAKTGIDPSLGTFNLRVVPEDMAKLASFRKKKGIVLPPGQAGFCAARAFLVLIAGKIKGAAMFPDVDDYPDWQLEMVAECHVRETLRLKEGDEVEVEVFVPYS